MLATDSAGAERTATLLYVSATQINYIVPRGTAIGPATVRVVRDSRAVAAGSIAVERVAPTLFSANGDGRGVAAASATRIAADGSQSQQPAFRCDSPPASCAPVPIDLGAPSDQVVLSLFGTGIRGMSGPAAVSVRIGGVQAPLVAAGPHSTAAALDEVSVTLPRALAGRGELPLELTVDGKPANTVTVAIR